jgi:hypothetical protein
MQSQTYPPTQPCIQTPTYPSIHTFTHPAEGVVHAGGIRHHRQWHPMHYVNALFHFCFAAAIGMLTVKLSRNRTYKANDAAMWYVIQEERRHAAKDRPVAEQRTRSGLARDVRRWWCVSCGCLTRMQHTQQMLLSRRRDGARSRTGQEINLCL